MVNNEMEVFKTEYYEELILKMSKTENEEIPPGLEDLWDEIIKLRRNITNISELKISRIIGINLTDCIALFNKQPNRFNYQALKVIHKRLLDFHDDIKESGGSLAIQNAYMERGNSHSTFQKLQFRFTNTEFALKFKQSVLEETLELMKKTNISTYDLAQRGLGQKANLHYYLVKQKNKFVSIQKAILILFHLREEANKP